MWGVTEPALAALVPGGSVTLEVDDPYYLADLSSFSRSLPVGTTVYAQVDSFNPDSLTGTVLEGHEIRAGAYNNVYGPVRSTAGVLSETRLLCVQAPIELGHRR